MCLGRTKSALRRENAELRARLASAEKHRIASDDQASSPRVQWEKSARRLIVTYPFDLCAPATPAAPIMMQQVAPAQPMMSAQTMSCMQQQPMMAQQPMFLGAPQMMPSFSAQPQSVFPAQFSTPNLCCCHYRTCSCAAAAVTRVASPACKCGRQADM